MNTQSKREFIIDVAYYSIIFGIIYLVIKYFLGVLFPFVLGFVIAFSLKPVIRWIVKKTKLNNKFVSIIILLLFYALIGFGLFLLIVQGVSMLSQLFEQFPSIYARDIQPLITSVTQWMGEIVYKIDPEIVVFVEQFETSILTSLADFVKSFSAGSISFLTSVITKVPGFFLAFFFSIISSFFITLDYEKITSFLTAQFSGRGQRIFTGIQQNGLLVLLNFIKAYGVIIFITFVESAVGLKILGVHNAMGISIIIAVVDILPVLGTGTVMIPWAFIELFNGNIGLAIGLGVLYIIITVIRQILEPRIVGDHIGLYPLVTLISMYIGTRYFGIAGLFLIPIAVTIIVKMQQDGIIKVYKEVDDSKAVVEEFQSQEVSEDGIDE